MASETFLPVVSTAAVPFKPEAGPAECSPRVVYFVQDFLFGFGRAKLSILGAFRRKSFSLAGPFAVPVCPGFSPDNLT